MNINKHLGVRRERRPRVSIHFDVDSQELRQLLHTCVVNLLGQPQPQPMVPPQPQQPLFP